MRQGDALTKSGELGLHHVAVLAGFVLLKFYKSLYCFYF